MELTQRNINLLLNNYIPFVDEISDDNRYSDNIRHLLYIIVPGFIAKYSPTKEPIVLKCFSDVKININPLNKTTLASFERNIKKVGEECITDKCITISPFEITSISDVLDTIIYEFNHALNSINNEIKIDSDYIKVRTGLSYLNYNKDNLAYVNRTDETVLEELLNTVQTEEIVNLIKSFGDFEIENEKIANTIYTVCSELKNKKIASNAYQFQRQVCAYLMDNKTFIPTVNKLRLKGTIEDVQIMFDDVIGKPNSFKQLNKLLTEMYDEILKYGSNTDLEKVHLNRIMELAKEVTKLIKEYEIKRIFR